MTDKKGATHNERLDITFHIQLTLEAPILTRATEASPGFSETAARDHKGQFYLAGSLIKGNLKQTFQKYINNKSKIIPQLFGNESEENTFDKPIRGSLHFSDFITQEKSDENIATRIQIDPKRGAVHTGQLAFLELPFAPRKEVVFTGTIRGVAENQKDYKIIKQNISKAIRLVPAFGGQQGIGYGRLKKVEITGRAKPFPTPNLLECEESCPNYFNISFIPQAPFCLADHLPLKNRFEAKEIISGAVIKGILAHTLNRITGRDLNSAIDDSLPEPWAELGRHFSRIQINHAFPANGLRDGVPANPSSRPIQPPLTTVRAGGNTYDIALRPGPGLIASKAPAFAADWKSKDWHAVMTKFDWPDNLRKILRVRTEIEEDKRRAKDEQLFAMELVIPDDHEWLGRVDFRFDEHPVIAAELRKSISCQFRTLLEYGLFGLGKTKVEVKTHISTAEPPAIDCKPFYQIHNNINTPIWVITLQTDAMIINPETIGGPENCTTAHLKKEYERYWETIDEDIKVKTHFSAQILYGRYLSRRFQKDKPYNPYILTKAGSVFILSTKNEGRYIKRIGEKLAKLQQNNLPLPNWTEELYGNDSPVTWQNCPWLPEHGYGEIKVNLPFHSTSCPDWEDI